MISFVQKSKKNVSGYQSIVQRSIAICFGKFGSVFGRILYFTARSGESLSAGSLSDAVI